MITVLNPATEETIAVLPAAGVEETDAAVSAAKAAFSSWRSVAPSDRARVLRGLAELVEEHAAELALLETRNVGKPIADSRGEVGMVPRERRVLLCERRHLSRRRRADGRLRDPRVAATRRS